MAEDLGLFGWNLADPPFECYFTEVIPPNNIWWLSRSSPCLHFPSKFEWPPLSFFVNTVRSYCNRYTMFGVDWPFASLLRRGLLCRGEAGEKKREARKARWERERKKKGAFSLSPSSPARLVYFDYCYFYWDTQREPLQRRATFCFLLTPRRSRNAIAVLIFLINSIGLSKL